MTNPNPLTRWTVYGRKRATAGGKTVSAGVHADRLDSLAAAKQFLTHQVMLGGHVDAVIVELLDGEDVHTKRRVVHRVGDGKGWWE